MQCFSAMQTLLNHTNFFLSEKHGFCPIHPETPISATQNRVKILFDKEFPRLIVQAMG
jgi:hypothetical protein